MKKLLICLAPIMMSFLLLLSKGDSLILLVLILIPVGSLLSAFFAAEFVYMRSDDSGFAKGLLVGITFLVVGVAYLALGIFGGCSFTGGFF